VHYHLVNHSSYNSMSNYKYINTKDLLCQFCKGLLEHKIDFKMVA